MILKTGCLVPGQVNYTKAGTTLQLYSVVSLWRKVLLYIRNLLKQPHVVPKADRSS